MRNPLDLIQRIYARIFYLSILIVLFVLFAIIGLMYIQGYDFLESFWTVTNLITTVGSSIDGYDDLREPARWFILFIMWVGIFIFLVTITMIAYDLLEGTYQKALKIYKMEKKLSALDNHVIICGFGRNGRQAARKLQGYNRKFVVIDKNPIDKYEDTEFSNALFFMGDATLDSTLKTCGVERASSMISAMPSDANNLFSVITARQLNPNIKIISRASDSNSIEKLRIAGANNVIMPDKIGGEHMASLVVTPDLVEFLDEINFEGGSNKNLLEVATNDIPKEYIGKTLEEYYNSLNTHTKIVGYKVETTQYIMNPDSSEEIKPNNFIIFFGRNEQITDLMKQLGLK